MTRHVPVKLPRHVRRMMAAPPVSRYHRREFRTSDQRNALYVQLHGRVPGLVRYSDVTEAGTIYVLAWPEQGRGIGANRDTTPASMVRILLAAFAQAQRQWQHADNHGQRRHQHRAETGKAGFDRGADGIAGNGQALAGEAHHQDRVGGAHAHAHDGAGQGRHRQSGAGGEQRPDDAGQGGGQGGDDHKGIKPGLEVHHNQQIDEHNRAHQAEQQAGKGSVHGDGLAAQGYHRSARQILSRSGR